MNKITVGYQPQNLEIIELPVFGSQFMVSVIVKRQRPNKIQFVCDSCPIKSCNEENCPFGINQ